MLDEKKIEGFVDEELGNMLDEKKPGEEEVGLKDFEPEPVKAEVPENPTEEDLAEEDYVEMLENTLIDAGEVIHELFEKLHPKMTNVMAKIGELMEKVEPEKSQSKTS